jgi:peptidoglycan/LPS O-acetylase OafA/YrhL
MSESKADLNPIAPKFSLQRIITSNRFIPEVDGFRFVAIVVVVISHVYANCGPIPAGGWFEQLFRLLFSDGPRGVFLFFTISGFILALPFARHHLQGTKRVDLLSYFKRRVTRLEPPYILAMVGRVLLLFFYKHLALTVLGAHLLASLFYVHGLVFNQYPLVNPPAWSLEVEIQFYLLAPFLTALFMIRSKLLRRAVLVGLTLGAGVLADTMIAPDTRASLSLLHFFHYFLAGFLLCDLYLCGDKLPLPKWGWDVLGVASLAWILLSQATWFHIALPFATLLLYLAGFHGGVVRAFFAFRPISLIGGMCYSLYLTHTTVLTGFSGIVQRLAHSALPAWVAYPLMFALPMAGILLVGTIFFILIERPCMDPQWPQKLAVKLGWSTV